MLYPTARKQKQRKEEAPRVPRSLFDRPNSALVKMRREMKLQKLKAGLGMHKQPLRPSTLPTHLPPKPVMEQSEGHLDWLIHEDWALLQVHVQACMHRDHHTCMYAWACFSLSIPSAI